MTAIFELNQDVDRYQSLTPVAESALERLMGLGEQKVERWRPPNLRWIGATRKGDFPYLTPAVPVVSDRALEVLNPLLGASTDVLDINVPGGGYVALHVRDFPDCLDTERSVARWLEPGHAYKIDKHVFIPECLEGHHLFRLPQLRDSAVYLSDTAMSRIREAKLEGLLETKVWEG